MTSPRAKTTKALVLARDALKGFRSGAYPSADHVDMVIDRIEAALLTNFLTNNEGA